MTRAEAESKYAEMFGGLPMFIVESCDDEYVAKELENAVIAKKEIECDEDKIY